ncbi:hypothetical protein [Photobacterium nomapromontoriensis]|uniref:hypothetical protein n=1 Tax=Photobacterium nomapromontoriensis TaxID=2910237 RepID=UPI003D11C274
MKQAIDFSTQHQTFLDVGSRRKSPNAFMLLISNGCALIRLGKHEFVITAGSGFYIPFDCLHAVTILPGTDYSKVEFSARLTLPICRDAGYIHVNPLIASVAAELVSVIAQDNAISLSGETGNLLRVLADQAAKLTVSNKSICPGLSHHYQTPLMALLKGDKVTDSDTIASISQFMGYSIKEIESCILMREALKLSRSGRKIHYIAETLNTSQEMLIAMADPILGHTL